MNYFYQKLIIIEPIIEELHNLDLSDEEKGHLASLIDSTLHNVIIDEILSNLSNDDKKLFLKKIHEDPRDTKLLDFLNEKTENIESKIKKVSDDLIKEIHQEIKKAKK